METFTIADSSTKPYAHMVENMEIEDIESAEDFVEGWARTAINATNYGEKSDYQIYREWLETGEFEAAVSYVNQWIKDNG